MVKLTNTNLFFCTCGIDGWRAAVASKTIATVASMNSATGNMLNHREKTQP